MKTVTLALSFFLVSMIAIAQDNNGVDITVTIDNVQSNEGQVLLGLHTAETFMKGPGIQNLQSNIEDGKVTMTFTNVAPGTYAIMALHDANGNKRMDYEPNGMPKESYGMSGNDMTMGPPNFNSAQFQVANENLELNIRF
ncbi:DUF2141 domain-containing protein [Flagellimonas sp. MMG031]|uniref:DUF2141 domain-containing protein n=1 Tax=Flagellimonas sp. MMG031 TaxID=3158549 RepID=A0AAU7MW16_9FLAO|nr:DUF2141 domain-containing protein [Allomuricauda sp.]MBO6533961.1 DUF2141 domain-containing protein [Allomuricauda sp.]MBO6588927.1 DUF2141 domain-containing protein [Allomuricauda sp.]MBO6618552.1 DUF2141 domain-containing protein [Allomuricauda sp.]MBO6644465.1 DUF2141 domain-containing protein [Allomuricauda sp.]MBO6746365.1 DUF2141 domain-containing protein [Allomuricauda sp.]